MTCLQTFKDIIWVTSPSEFGFNELWFADQFQCAHGKKCIEKSQVCDGVPQCQDRSDELECAKYMEGCAHQCDDGSRCIPSSFLCDGERDCADSSDEASCGTSNKSCKYPETLT